MELRKHHNNNNTNKKNKNKQHQQQQQQHQHQHLFTPVALITGFILSLCFWTKQLQVIFAMWELPSSQPGCSNLELL